MINFQRILGEPESREDKLRRMWTRIYEADQRRKQEEIIQDVADIRDVDRPISTGITTAKIDRALVRDRVGVGVQTERRDALVKAK